MRSWTSGMAAASVRASCSDTGSSITPRSTRTSCTRRASSSVGRARIQSPLIDVHFFRSKRAGLALTRSSENAAAICSLEKNSRSSPIDQPSSAR